MSPLGIGLAVAVGLALGLLGGGGSILTVPILVYVVGLEPKEAIATSLAVVGAASLIGVLGHWRAGNVNLRVAAVFAVVAMTGSFLGTRLATLLSGTTQLALFALVMLLAAFFMLRDRRRAVEPVPSPARSRLDRVRAIRIVAAGLAVGALTGLVGVGGGFLVVPALVLLLDLPMKESVGTSLAVIALNAATGFAGYAGQLAINWGLTVTFAGAAAAGILVGSSLARFVSPRLMRRGFAFFLVGMGAFILYQNRLALLPA